MRRPGFTLMELLVYLGISTLVILVISKFMIDVSANAARNRASLELQANVRLVINRIAQNIRTSAALAVSANSLDVTVPGGDHYIYTLSGTAVQEARTGSVNSTDTLTDSTVEVSTLSFDERTAGVQVTLTATSIEGVGIAVPPHQVITTITPRSAVY